MAGRTWARFYTALVETRDHHFAQERLIVRGSLEVNTSFWTSRYQELGRPQHAPPVMPCVVRMTRLPLASGHG
jgi:hypothetical protein